MSASTPVLDPSLGLVASPAEGGVRLEAQGHRLEDGTVLHRLRLFAPGGEVGAPLERLRPTSSRLEALEIELPLERVRAALAEQAGPGAEARVAWSDELLEIEIERGGRLLLARAALFPDPKAEGLRSFLLDLDQPLELGPPARLGEAALEALGRALGLGAERLSTGRLTARIDPVTPLLRLLPRHGWKLPAVEGLTAGPLRPGPGGGLLVEVAASPPAPSRSTRRRAEAVEAWRALPPPPETIDEAWLVAERSSLDARLEPRPRCERALWLAQRDPALARFTLELAEAALALDGGDPAALAARAALADRGDAPELPPAPALEQLAVRLRTAGERRRPSRVSMRAAEHASGEERARLYEEAVVIRPDDPRALRGLVDALLPLGRTSAAIRAARRLASLAPTSAARARASADVGRLLAEAGDLPGARRELERAAKQDPSATDIVVELARVQAREGRGAEAERRLEEALEHGADGRLYAELARLRLARDDPEGALEPARRALEAEPERVELAELLVRAARRIDEARGAIELADRLLDAEPEGDPSEARRLQLAVAALYEASGDAENAARHLRAAFALGLDREEELQEVVRVAELVGDAALALEARVRLGARAAARGDTKAATEVWRPAALGKGGDEAATSVRHALEASLRARPRDRALLELAVELARAHREPQRLAEALAARARLDDPAPEKAELLSELARAHRACGRPLAAVRALEEAAELAPERADLLERVADLHRARDDRTRLAEVLGRLADRLPEEERGPRHAERARILAAAGRDAEAHEAIGRALDAGDQAPMTWSLATVLALRLGRFEEARDRARARLEALAEGPDEAKLPIWVDLARVAEALEDAEGLLEALRSALALAPPGSAVARQIGDRLAQELEAAGREAELAELDLARGADPTASPAERAEWWARAARRLAALGQRDRATEAAESILALEERSPAVDHARDEALSVLEDLARAVGDPTRLADVLGARAERASTEEAGQRLRLEQVELLESAGRLQNALSAATRAAEAFPESIALAARLGGVAESAGEGLVAGEAFARAAALAEAGPRTELAPGLHARAATAFVTAGAPERATEHDRKVIAAAREGAPGRPEALAALDRLERRARAAGDVAELIDLLRHRSSVATGADRAVALEALAELAEEAGRTDEAIGALEEARVALGAVDRGAPLEALEERLDAALARAGRARARAQGLERRAKASAAPEAAGLWVRAARLYAEDLDDVPRALDAARAARDADPSLEAPRDLLLRLLRARAPSSELGGALEEAGSRTDDAETAAELWLEGARAFLALEPPDRDRAADLARRAATARPRDAAPIRLGLEALEGREDVDGPRSSLLGQLAERTDRPEERLLCRLKRSRLLAERFQNPTSALAELSALLEAPEGPRRAALRAMSPTDPRPERSLFVRGAELARAAEDPEAEEVYLFRWEGLAREDGERLEILTRRAELLDGPLSDPDGAEEAWRSVLRLEPGHARARAALWSRLAEAGRFDELAALLGPEALEEAWSRAEGPARFDAARALWTVLGAGPRRAEVHLTTADELLAADPTSTDAEALLSEVAEARLPPHSGRAWRRLAELRGSRADLVGAAEAELARAREAEAPEERAEALAAVAELRLRFEDDAGAEAALAEARSLDARQPRVREVLEAFLGSRGRFEELAEEVGPEALARVLEQLLAAPELHQDALRAARALAPWIGPEAPRMWLGAADAFAAAEHDELETAALEACAKSASAEAGEALARLAARAGADGDLEALAAARGRQVELAGSPEAAVEARLEHAAALRAWTADGGPAEAETEAEEVLYAARALGLRREAVDDALEALWVDRRAFDRVASELGLDRLAAIASRARALEEPELERAALQVWADHVEGPERAGVFVRVADTWGEAAPEAELEALLAAAAADPRLPELRPRLSERLAASGRFEALAGHLGASALEAWIDAHPADDRRPEALEALARRWAEEGEVPGPRVAEIWHLSGEGYRERGDPEAAERAFRAAITSDAAHEPARAALAALLTAAGRLEALADVDPGLLEASARRAEAGGEAELALAAWRVLAARRVGRDRAEALSASAPWAAEVEGREAEERAVLSALEAEPSYAPARERAAELLWSAGAPGRLVEVLGADALFARTTAAAEEDVGSAVSALALARDRFEAADRARADELAASWTDPRAEPGLDLRRRREALLAARFTWDQLGRESDGARVRKALVALLRDADDRPAYLDALEDAWDQVRGGQARAALGLELARAKVEDAPDEASAIFEALAVSPEVERATRGEAARALVELHAAALRDIEGASPGVRAALLDAHELLAEEGALDRAGLKALSTLRAAAERSPESVVEPLERALAELDDPLSSAPASSGASDERLERALAELDDPPSRAPASSGASDERVERALAELDDPPSRAPASSGASDERVERALAELDDPPSRAPASSGASDERLELHRLALGIWDGAGAWAQAEPHAARVFELSGRAADGILVAELRAWLNDLDGAEQAATEAEQTAPDDPRVHEQLVRLAERGTDAQRLAERLERFAESDRAASAPVRADRLLRAAEAALRAADHALAGRAAVRALELDLTPDRLETADRLLAAAPELGEDRVRLLRLGLRLGDPEAVRGPPDNLRAQAARVRLVEVLEGLGRSDEAHTVLAGAFEDPLGADDPSLLAALDPARGLAPSRLLEWAGRLGDGEAAQRLRSEAARRAEAEADVETARSAWSQVVASSISTPREAGAARDALLRLAREEHAPERLVGLLEEAADDAGADEAALELWLEAARVAERELDDPDRAMQLLDRGFRAVAEGSLAKALVELYERHERWLALDAWLERQRASAEGPERARWARLRADRLDRHLGDRPTAARLWAESDALVPDLAVGLAAARAEEELGAHEAAARRAAELASRREVPRAARIELVRIRAHALEALGRSGEAADILAEAIHDLPAAEILFDERLALLERRREVEAWVDTLTDGLERVPASVAAVRAVAAARAALDRLGDRDRALALLEAAARGPLELEGAAELAALAERLARVDLARPQRARLQAELGSAAAELDLLALDLERDPDDAVPRLERLAADLPEAPDRARADALLAGAFEARGRYGDAAEAWARAGRALEATDLEVASERWGCAARAHARSGAFAAALEALERVRGCGGDAGALEAELLGLDIPSPERAEALLARAEAGPPGDSDAWRRAAEALEAAGLAEEAQEARLELALRAPAPADFERLELDLQARERWSDLARVLEADLARGGHGPKEARDLAVWLGRVALRLDAPERARPALMAARARGADDLELLELLAQIEEARGDGASTIEVLSEIAARAPTPERRERALLRTAHLHVEADRPELALATLEGAIDSGSPRDLRGWAEQVHASAKLLGAHDRAARVWARHAASCAGAESGASLARAARLRWEGGVDRRGALAAIDGAVRRCPGDLGIAWLAVELHTGHGDFDRAAGHARRALDLDAGWGRAAFATELARLSGDLEAWRLALELEASRESALEHLGARMRAGEAPGAEALLAELELELPEPVVTAPDELVDADEGRRAELDMGGRWSELAELEAARAESLDDPRERAEAWLEVAAAHARVDDPSARAEQRVALERAVDADPLWPRPHAEALEAALEGGDLDRARELAEHLFALGGAGRSPPWLELTAAEIEGAAPEARLARLDAALARDPGHLGALEQAALVAFESDPETALPRAEAWSARIDPVLDPGAAGRARRLGARAAAAAGDVEGALSRLRRADPADAALEVELLERVAGAPEILSEALERCFDHDRDPRWLVRAAELGVRLEAIEARAAAFPQRLPALDAALQRAWAERRDGPRLLRWALRAGASAVRELEDPDARRALARAALEEGEDAVLLAALDAEGSGEGLGAVVGDAPLAGLVRRLEARGPTGRALLARLSAARPEDLWLQSRGVGDPDLDDAAALAACDAALRLDPTDVIALRRRVELLGAQADGLGPAMVLAWLETGRVEDADPGPAVELEGPAALGRPSSRPLPWPWDPARLRPGGSDPRLVDAIRAAGVDPALVELDPEGGTRAARREGSIVIGEGLAEDATAAELRFHLARLSRLGPHCAADDPAPERAGLAMSGSLGATVQGLLRGLFGPTSPRSLPARRALVLRRLELLDIVRALALRTPEGSAEPVGGVGGRF